MTENRLRLEGTAPVSRWLISTEYTPASDRFLVFPSSRSCKDVRARQCLPCCIWFLYIITQRRTCSSHSFNNLCLSTGPRGLTISHQFAKDLLRGVYPLAIAAHLAPMLATPLLGAISCSSCNLLSSQAPSHSTLKLLTAMRELVVTEDINLIDLCSVPDSCPSRGFVQELHHFQRESVL